MKRPSEDGFHGNRFITATFLRFVKHKLVIIVGTDQHINGHRRAGGIILGYRERFQMLVAR